jgi:3-dehydroquinate dehydratase-1
MICISIEEQGIDKCLSDIEKAEMAEIRLDLTGFSMQDIERVFASGKKLIATCRPGTWSDTERKEKLITAIKAGATYVDIEYESPAVYRKELIKTARTHTCDVIISYQNTEHTPSLKELERIMHSCFEMGADVARIATQVRVNRDNSKILSLYKAPGRLVAIGMGELGKISRIVAPFLGAEFTFAALDDGGATPPGQIRYSKLSEFMIKIQEI